jgi:hypothetical protein
LLPVYGPYVLRLRCFSSPIHAQLPLDELERLSDYEIPSFLNSIMPVCQPLDHFCLFVQSISHSRTLA